MLEAGITGGVFFTLDISGVVVLTTGGTRILTGGATTVLFTGVVKLAASSTSFTDALAARSRVSSLIFTVGFTVGMASPVENLGKSSELSVVAFPEALVLIILGCTLETKTTGSCSPAPAPITPGTKLTSPRSCALVEEPLSLDNEERFIWINAVPWHCCASVFATTKPMLLNKTRWLLLRRMGTREKQLMELSFAKSRNGQGE